MMDTRALRRGIGETLRESGMIRRGGGWTRTSDEVTWTVLIDKIPRGKRHRFELDLTLAALADDDGPDAGIAAVSLVQEEFDQLVGVDVLELDRAMNLDESIPDSDRMEIVGRFAGLLAGYAADRMTFEAVRASYQAGEFRSSFVYRRAAELFDNPQ